MKLRKRKPDDDADHPRPRPRPPPAERPLFVKDLEQNGLYQLLKKRHSDGAVAARCVVADDYRVPMRLIDRDLSLEHVLTTEPKKVYNPMLGKETSEPYALYEEDLDDGHYSVPRAFGSAVFGRGGTVQVAEVAPTTPFPEMLKPLLDEEQGKALFKADQQTAVDEACCKLAELADNWGFGSGVYVLPTGFGKTFCAMHLIVRHGLRALFVIPNIKAFAQFKDEFRTYMGPDVRVETAHTADGSLKAVAKIMATFAERGVLVAAADGTYTAAEWAEPKMAKGRKQKAVLETLLAATEPMTPNEVLRARRAELDTCGKTKYLRDRSVHIVLTTHASAAQCEYDLQDFGLVIVDEAHETVTTTYSAMYRRFPTKYVIALTATPERTNECGAYLQWLCGPVLHRREIDVATDTQWGGIDVRIVPIHYATRKPLEVKRVQSFTGTKVVSAEAMTRQVMYCKQRNDAVCAELCQLVREEKRHIVLFCTRIEHLERMQKLLQGAGIDAGILIDRHSDGTKTTQEEDEHAYRCRVLLAQIRMGHRMLNIPRLDTVGFLSGGAWKSRPFWVQGCGRALRSLPGKNKPLVLLFEDQTVDNGVGGTYFEKQIERAIQALSILSSDPAAISVKRVAPVRV